LLERRKIGLSASSPTTATSALAILATAVLITAAVTTAAAVTPAFAVHSSRDSKQQQHYQMYKDPQ
jgi:hypothetical protein